MLKVKKILLEVKDENGNIMFGEFDDSKSALAEVEAIKSSDCGWKLYNVSIYLIDEEEYKQERYELYKASKLYVRSTRNYGEFGLLEVWKIVNGKRYGEEITNYFKETILEEYREAKKRGLVK